MYVFFYLMLESGILSGMFDVFCYLELASGILFIAGIWYTIWTVLIFSAGIWYTIWTVVYYLVLVSDILSRLLSVI